MVFKVEHLGPVERAEIDLSKDLILLTGPNGTGKTYVAWAAYGLLKMWQGPLFIDLLEKILTPVADRLLANRESEFDLTALIQEYGAQVIDRVAEVYSKEIADDFAAERQLFEHTRVHFEPGVHAWRTDFQRTGSSPRYPDWKFNARRKPDSTVVSIQVGQVGQEEESLYPLGELPQEHHAAVRDRLAVLLAAWMLQARPHGQPVIFPAERIATTIFARELSSHRTELVQDFFGHVDTGILARMLRQRAQRYPGPIHDSLQMAGNLATWSRQQSEFAELADYLENRLLRGKVRLSAYGQLEFVPAQHSEVVLGVHITASMVKSLSLLVFYFRHMAQAGDFIVIDEPELNLHPDNQRWIARVLARAVNRGLKIMASTHSDYLIRELNNLIMLGQDTDRIRALQTKLGYEEAEVLKPSQLGVYLFHNNMAEAVPVAETGFAIETIDAEVNRLNAVSQDLYATLLDQEP